MAQEGKEGKRRDVDGKWKRKDGRGRKRKRIERGGDDFFATASSLADSDCKEITSIVFGVVWRSSLKNMGGAWPSVRVWDQGCGDESPS